MEKSEQFLLKEFMLKILNFFILKASTYIHFTALQVFFTLIVKLKKSTYDTLSIFFDERYIFVSPFLFTNFIISKKVFFCYETSRKLFICGVVYLSNPSQKLTLNK